ncbi:hypothetical protein E2562_028861, partial [Oryza meyeriana var. granulata]
NRSAITGAGEQMPATTVAPPMPSATRSTHRRRTAVDHLCLTEHQGEHSTDKREREKGGGGRGTIGGRTVAAVGAGAVGALFATVLGHDAVHHLATTPSHLDAPEAVSASPSLAELQARLHDLVEQKGGTWTYDIFWQESRRSGANGGRAVLGWGDGYCRDGAAGAETGEVGAAERSMARKRVLLRLHALYGGGDDEGADYALRLDRVTGAEIYFLSSMYFSFPEGAGGPGRALASGRHAWAEVDPNSSSTRARQVDTGPRYSSL